MNINDLTLAEIADVERLSGRSIATLGDDDTPRGKMLQALVYVIKRKENANFKFEEAGNIPMGEAMELILGDEPDFREGEE